MTGWRFLALVAAFALASASCGGDATGSAPTSTGTPASAEAPVVQAISGNQIDFSDTLTQDTVMWFWAPW